MTNKIVKVKNGKITLPKEVSKKWRGADVFMGVSEDTVVLKKIKQPATIFDPETVKKLKAIGKKISKKDVADAIAWVRSQAKTS